MTVEQFKQKAQELINITFPNSSASATTIYADGYSIRYVVDINGRTLIVSYNCKENKWRVQERSW